MATLARKAALTALLNSKGEAYSSAIVLDESIRKYALSGRDAALAARLYLGTLQNRLFCDSLLRPYLQYPDKIEAKIAAILALGTYELTFCRTPPRAVVNDCVELCRDFSCKSASGLVNAVLRRVSENGSEKLPELSEKTPETLSVRYSHPLWLAEKIVSQHGIDFAEQFFAVNNEEPPLTIQINTLRISPEDYCALLQSQKIPYERQEAFPALLRLKGGHPTDLPGFREGLFYVQDKAALCAAFAAEPGKGFQLLDACSAPGGKSIACAIQMENEGSILSCDLHEKKLSRVLESSERLGIRIIRTQAMDASKHCEKFDSLFDVVIADVPCSGFGVIQKKPEIRYKKPENLTDLPLIQRNILDNVSQYVKPGGVLLYSTCTVFPEENEDVISAFLAGRDDFILEPFTVGDISSSTGMRTFWPQIDHTDGFFICKMRKKQTI